MIKNAIDSKKKVSEMQNGFHPGAALSWAIRQFLLRSAHLHDLHLRPHFHHHPTSPGQSEGLDPARLPTRDAHLLNNGGWRTQHDRHSRNSSWIGY